MRVIISSSSRDVTVDELFRRAWNRRLFEYFGECLSNTGFRAPEFIGAYVDFPSTARFPAPILGFNESESELR